MPNDGTKRRRVDEEEPEESAEKTQRREATSPNRDHEERKIDDTLIHNSESMNRAMCVQALLHRGISSSVLPQLGSPDFLSAGFSSNAALQILTQERTGAGMAPNLRTNVPDLAYQNAMNLSGSNLVGSVGPSSGLSPLVSDYLLSNANLINYQQRLDAAIASNRRFATFQGLPNIGAGGLSPMMIEEVLSRANAINHQGNLDQALAIIAENESARRVRQEQLLQSNRGMPPDLYSTMLWNSSGGNQSVTQNTDLRNRVFLQNRPLTNAIEATNLTSPTESRGRPLLAALNVTRGFEGPLQPVPERVRESNVVDNQRPDGVLLATADDEKNLSEYQSLIRKQLEFFEATEDDVNLTTQGRKKTVYVGQVGVRCVHCAHRPVHLRSRGSVYFPSKLSSVYQAAQNMAVSHLMDACDEINETVREQLCSLRLRKDTAAGGKAYWASSCAKVGVSETETGLRLIEVLRRIQST